MFLPPIRKAISGWRRRPCYRRFPFQRGIFFASPSENPDASAVAAAYEQTLRKFWPVESVKFPRFDLILLGMGRMGTVHHCFPETAALREKSRLVWRTWVEKIQNLPDHVLPSRFWMRRGR